MSRKRAGASFESIQLVQQVRLEQVIRSTADRRAPKKSRAAQPGIKHKVQNVAEL